MTAWVIVFSVLGSMKAPPARLIAKPAASNQMIAEPVEQVEQVEHQSRHYWGGFQSAFVIPSGAMVSRFTCSTCSSNSIHFQIRIYSDCSHAVAQPVSCATASEQLLRSETPK